MMTFESLGLTEPLLRTLNELGYTTPTTVQAAAIPAVLARRDLLAAAQTGTGKTAGFALPILQRLANAGAHVAANSVRALVLVPTRELAEQVHQSFRSYGEQLAVRTAVAYGGVSINPQMMRLRRGAHVLVATPGRLLDLHRQNAVRFDQLHTLVLDEADRMLDLGFARDLEQVFALMPRRHQTLLFSATFSDEVRSLAGELLFKPLTIDASPANTVAEGITQQVVVADKKRKPELCIELLKRNRWPQVLVFAKTRKGTDQLVTQLLQHGIAADSIHGDKPQPARLKALTRFKSGEVAVLVATDVAARGLDIVDMPVVINLDLPIVAEDYVHRIGRTGRAGASGKAISLVSADEVRQLAAIEALIGRALPRREEPDFAPSHTVPATGRAAEKAGKAKAKAKKKKKLKQQDKAPSSSARSKPGRGARNRKAADAGPKPAHKPGRATAPARKKAPPKPR